ncbi:MAG TPA: DNA polymerase III subunit gamma/tau [Pusillimonas sp.]|uniref:DNA polymerase III subunit gamma/tau n=1 Tax=Pusillimonas sp. TaxID=3040095 RepID=UPI002B775361|nr:DNA polymerase III subunit gamma/tau [Pusillimonas sp.]HUH88074.1 DNA polymerase III subunit gamma/tau [Pusillimonas sp.]
MTYLVLARKWRPRSFDTLVGQDHVVRALTHALSTQRLHHAWLFTGTRGVGKTTLSRILAKSLNCETGITATPCGACRACTEIDAGRFVDYVELDAASNRGVDEMTQLLEQAVYAPGSGRFKVYMIDEVHMLTGHAFNAMLKTLEEPPPHVKFILATTDPQKIPVTVLSRCLQFNLKQMTSEAIVEHLQTVLAQEDVEFQIPALRLIAQAASGSMRDALSLTDQAIAYSAGNLTAEAMQGMLGTIDQRYLARLLRALAAGSGADVLHVADELATRGLSYSGALADLAILLSRVAIQQRIPGAIAADEPMFDEIAELAGLMHSDLVQLFYSVAVHSRNELSLAPDEYAGFVMACLRMLALAPQAEPVDPLDGGSSPSGQRPAAGDPAPAPSLATASPASTQAISASAQPVAGALSSVSSVQSLPVQAPTASAPAAPREAVAVHSFDEQQADSVDPHDIPAWEDIPPAVEAGPPGVDAGHPNFDAGDPSVDPGHPDVDAGDLGVDVGQYESFVPDDSEYDAYGQYQSLDEDIPADVDAANMVAVNTPVFASERPKLRSPKLSRMDGKAWPALAAQLPVTGLAAELARQSEWLGTEGDQIRLRVAVRTLAATAGKARLCTVLSEHFGTVVQLDVEFGATGEETAHAVAQAERAARQKQAEHDVQADPFVQALIQEFGAKVIPGSVRAVFNDRAA